MALFKRDFKAFAEIVKTITPAKQRQKIAVHMAEYFCTQNSNFSIAKWMEACEVA